MDTPEFLRLLKAGWSGLSEDTYQRMAEFREWVLDENSRQNLTKLESPSDFFEGHVLDVKGLLESDLVQWPAMDLGSGGGVPGLLAAIVRPNFWILAESEGHKASFLSRSVEKFELGAHVKVFSGRAEKYCGELTEEQHLGSVVARAVGPAERIFGWIGGCSTWNTLVLLKGPRWEEEWADFQRSRYRKHLTWKDSYRYSVGADRKERIIVRLERVPRGTLK